MTNPIFDINIGEFLISAEQAKARGTEFREKYLNAEPFPHICLDDVFTKSTLESVVQSIRFGIEGDRSFTSEHENLKSQTIPERLPTPARNFAYMLNSRPFLQFLEGMTGLKGLIPDPYFLGGGLHETKTGGYLDIHADFNHHAPLDLERRLNVLVYLNNNWSESYGGCLELWDSQMKRKFHSIVPAFNRMVVFSTTSDSMHGNPEPVAHPEGLSRRSIATYYYTATWDETRKGHTTIFKGRPGTDDASGLRGHIDRLLDDALPPIVNRQVKKLRRRLGV
jgi:hypothetical protein